MSEMDHDMDHAAAHERIEDLLLDPARLAALESSEAPEDVALREHVSSCASCRADLEGWQGLQRTIASALPGTAADAAAAVEPIELPPSLRAAVVSAIRAEKATGAAAPRREAIDGTRGRRARLWPLVGLAASLVVIVGSAGLAIDQVARRAAAEADVRALSAALSAADRILAEPAHKVVALQTPAGAGAGTISWSSHDWVVITTALTEPSSDQRYLCWLEHDGRSVPVGVMEFAGGTAYWVASLNEWATWELGPTTHFVVTLQHAGDQTRAGPAVLEAALGA